MRKFIKNNWIVVTITIALMASVSMAVRNKNTIEENSELQKQSEAVKQLSKEILSGTMHGLDLGLRGFSLNREENMLMPYKNSIKNNVSILAELESMLKKQKYPGLADLYTLKNEIGAYISLCDQMLELARQDSINAIISFLREDRGYAVWKKYEDFTKSLFQFEDKLYDTALANYKSAIRYNIILQVCISLLVLPALLLFMGRIRKESEARENLLMEVQSSDRKYVFDPGTEENLDAKAVIDSSIKNVRIASSFIKAMAKGDYNVEWPGLTQANNVLNRETLTGNLIDMREKLKQMKIEDDQRHWVNEGLAKFSEIVRNNQGSLKDLSEQCVSFLTKYMRGQQCSLFLLEGEGADKHLQLAAWYAFDRKKWIEKRIEIGVGLVGQAYLEGDTMELKNIPNGYLEITSGLGDSTPKHLIIVPLKYDIHTAAVIEMASFNFFEEYQINFLKKAGEFFSSAILNSQTTAKMRYLLDQSRVTEEKMKQTEEEMRQNIEELQATQEEFERREKEMKRHIMELRNVASEVEEI